ncbi:MAG TPA: hypothetical protein VMM78_01310 [Thermomicrobiales bacterium]|nr:hypothetical protein [Thermomicrobiales bacterium]
MIRLRNLLVLALCFGLLSACSGPQASRIDATATAESGTSLAQTNTPAPVAISATPASAATPTATLPAPTPASVAPTTPPPVATPTAPATATVANTPILAPEPTVNPAPVSQRVDLPDIDAHYQLTIDELRLGDGFVSASETITIREFRGAIPEQLYLQVVPAAFGFFTLRLLTVDGVATEPGTLNDGFTLVVDLTPETAAPLVIGVEFSLSVGVDPTGWGPTTLDTGILRLGNWFPVISNDHGYSTILDPSYTAIADFDVSVTLDAGYAFAHTGEIAQEREEVDGRVTYDLRAIDVRDFGLVVSRGFVVDEATTSAGVRVALYTTAAGSDARQNILVWAVDAIERMSELIAPYPYQSLRIVDAGPSMPGGLELPGLIYINERYPAMERLICHEVAHQWLYGVIGTRTLDDGWIDEGGAEFFERGLPTGFTEVPEPPAGGYLYPLDASYRELAGAAFIDGYHAIYEQGARLYYAVLDAMGWDAFWASMRGLYDTHAFGIVTAWDVLGNWQRHSAADLRPLLHEYFRYDWIDLLPEPGG